MSASLAEIVVLVACVLVGVNAYVNRAGSSISHWSSRNSATSPPPPIYGYIVPHSHDDVGWLLTYENYYELVVNHIYSTVRTLQAKRRGIFFR